MWWSYCSTPLAFLVVQICWQISFLLMFYLNMSFFFLPSFLNIFAEYRILGWLFFITLKMLVFSLWLPLFLMSAIFETFSPFIYKVLFFSGCFFNFLIIFGFQQFVIFSEFCFLSSWGLLSFLNL